MFLEQLQDQLGNIENARTQGGAKTREMIHLLTERYGLRTTQNSELKNLWFQLCFKYGLGDEVWDDAWKFASSIGRMKFARPMMRVMAAHISWGDVAQIALEHGCADVRVERGCAALVCRSIPAHISELTARLKICITATNRSACNFIRMLGHAL